MEGTFLILLDSSYNQKTNINSALNGRENSFHIPSSLIVLDCIVAYNCNKDSFSDIPTDILENLNFLFISEQGMQ